MCEDSFTCGSQIHILSYEIDGVEWFLFMLVLAFGLQWAANYIWVQNSQVTRELLQKPKDQRGGMFSGLMGKSMMWTLISTLIWIARIVLVMGSNIYIFIVVLLGNLIGVYFTQKNQKPDHHYLADDILLMLHRLRDPDPDCDKNDIKCHIREAVKGLKEAINEAESADSSNIEDDSGNPLQSLIRF
jgi:hypothetical protein